MKRSLSLRMRLTAIILLPVIAVAMVAGLWQLNNARRTASEVFDRSLLSAALAVANDVAISGGDALSSRTRDILNNTSGGLVFYHVYGPDGVIVAGYATPPVGIPRVDGEVANTTYFDAIYLGRSVRGVRLQNQNQVVGFSGIFTTTVWQDREVRIAFVRDLVMRSVLAITTLIGSLALIVWFGVRVGLRPLLDLEGAIRKRSTDELTPIRRKVPGEVEGIVRTLNSLFSQVSSSMTRQSEFISDAAHQLRNPIAGVLSLAEAVQSAPSEVEAKRRSSDLLEAARETADLSQKLLLLERAKSISPSAAREPVALDDALPRWIELFRSQAATEARIDLDIGTPLGTVNCDPTMLREALTNLLDNAVRHGGPDMTEVRVQANRAAGSFVLSVTDNGRGVAPEDMTAIKERFRTLSSTSGSGLGVSIVEAIAKGHGGQVVISDAAPGLRVEIRLPLQSV